MADSEEKQWDGPPPIPKGDIDVSCQGTVGAALQNALADLRNEAALDDAQCQTIQAAFGAALSETQAAQRQSEADGTCQAPAVLLQAKVEHYNRYFTKWRILLKDVQIQTRHPLPPNRRKRERPSLWKVQENESVVKLPKLELLAYNDIG